MGEGFDAEVVNGGGRRHQKISRFGLRYDRASVKVVTLMSFADCCSERGSDMILRSVGPRRRGRADGLAACV